VTDKPLEQGDLALLGAVALGRHQGVVALHAFPDGFAGLADERKQRFGE
jgi:hypothetical protein